jgi:hypothetical protein
LARGYLKVILFSIMPEGGLDVYELDQIADLMAFLESGEEKNAAGSVGGGSSR